MSRAPSSRIGEISLMSLGGLSRGDAESFKDAALSRAVGSHQCVDFALLDFEIDPFENRCATNGDVQVFNTECGHERELWVKSQGSEGRNVTAPLQIAKDYGQRTVNNY